MNGVTTASLSPVSVRWSSIRGENAFIFNGTERPYAPLLEP
jgi:hypothetical protein